MKILILCGGVGSRLWPLSNPSMPKQFLKINNNTYSLLQETIRRFQPRTPVKDFIFLSHKDYHASVLEHARALGDFQEHQVVCEPEGRNTLPAIMLGLQHLKDRNELDPNESLLICPSDHVISPIDSFLKATEAASALASQGFLVTFGLVPRYPETGYGYIQRKEKKLHPCGYLVEAFKEKPSYSKAVEYVNSGNTYWNAGIFCFSYVTFSKELEKHQPSMYNSFSNLKSEFSSLPKLSIDYGIMEKSSQIAVLPLDLEWSDLGSFEQLYENAPKNAQGNALFGDSLTIDSSGCYVFSKTKPLRLVEAKDLIVIETEEGVLITPRGKSQRVKEFEAAKNNSIC